MTIDDRCSLPGFDSSSSPGRDGVHSALQRHGDGNASTSQLLEAAIAAFGRAQLVQSVDLTVCAQPDAIAKVRRRENPCRRSDLN